MLFTRAQHRIVAAMLEAKARTAPAPARARLRQQVHNHRALARAQDNDPDLRPLTEISIAEYWQMGR
jgi:hypothetical protein